MVGNTPTVDMKVMTTMSENLPPLPSTDYLLATEDRPYEPSYVTNQDGYSEEQMWDYARATIAQQEAAGVASPMPGCEAWTIVVFKASDVPAGTEVFVKKGKT